MSPLAPLALDRKAMLRNNAGPAFASCQTARQVSLETWLVAELHSRALDTIVQVPKNPDHSIRERKLT